MRGGLVRAQMGWVRGFIDGCQTASAYLHGLKEAHIGNLVPSFVGYSSFASLFFLFLWQEREGGRWQVAAVPSVSRQ